jgi:hypothetical protein
MSHTNIPVDSIHPLTNSHIEDSIRKDRHAGTALNYDSVVRKKYAKPILLSYLLDTMPRLMFSAYRNALSYEQTSYY